MAVWVVRAGREGENENFFLDEGIAVIDFGVRQSIAELPDRESLPNNLSQNTVSQLWRFTNEMQVGDMVVLPRKLVKMVAVGKVTGAYVCRDDLAGVGSHTRAVEWQAIDIPRASFDQDLLYSIGGQLTVFNPRADNAEERIEQVVNAHLNGEVVSEADAAADSDDGTPLPDLREQNLDNIVGRIRQKFSGTQLEYLVRCVLEASGYTALQTRRGPDGGIDVIAGKGDLGFGEPRICVQVKSGRSPVELPDYNRLQGNVQGFGADHGLLVSLSDFTRAVRNENERSFFKIRLWGPYDLAQQVLDWYERLPADIRHDIPLENLKVLQQTAPDA